MYFIENRPAAIREVQGMLRAISYATDTLPRVPRDGIYGSETRAAVEAFQTQYELTPTGEVDYATFLRLWRESQALNPPAHATLAPLSYGMQGEEVVIYHALLRRFCTLHPHELHAPSHGYFSRATEQATEYLCRFFGLAPSRELDGRLETRLLTYLDSFGVKRAVR